MNIALADLLGGIRDRKAMLGIVDTIDRTEAMRNNGRRRTPKKRAMLERIDARADAVGVKPLSWTDGPV
jgi:hypothetical protein